MWLLFFLAQSARQNALEDCPPTQLLDCAQEVFRLTTEGWLDRALGAAQTLFVSLAVLEIVVTGYIYWSRRSKDNDLIGQFALKLGILAFVLGLLSTYHHWLPLIPEAFGESAMHIGGDVVTQLSPSHLLNIGVSILLSTLKAFGLTGDLIVLLAFVPASMIMMSFIVLAALLLVTMVESYIVVTGGLFFVGFTAFRGTAPMGDGYLQYILYVGVKLFFLMLVASIAAQIGDDMVALVAQYDNMWIALFERLFDLDPRGAADAITSRLGFLWAISAVSILLALLGILIPERIAQKVSSNVTFNLKGILQRL